METIVMYGILVLIIVLGVGIFIGTDPKKKPIWLYWLCGMCGLLIGLLLGFLRKDIFSGLKVGVIIALMAMFSSALLRWQKQRFSELSNWHKKRFKK